jgi:hypothetical protein
VHDQLGDHRVVVHRDLAALVDAGVHAHAVSSGGGAYFTEAPGRRQEVAERILRVDAALHRPAVARDLRLRERQLLAGRHADHQLDQVQPGDALGDRVLDLQPRVHLEEVEALVAADDELDRARPTGSSPPSPAPPPARPSPCASRRRGRAGRLLDHLLVAALDRALALPQVDGVAVRIAQHLDLDVARLLDELLDEDTRSSPKLLRASLRQEVKPSKASLSLKATRRPLPPPPALALIITG